MLAGQKLAYFTVHEACSGTEDACYIGLIPFDKTLDSLAHNRISVLNDGCTINYGYNCHTHDFNHRYCGKCGYNVHDFMHI